MKRLIKLAAIILLLRYGGDLLKDINAHLPSYQELKSTVLQFSSNLSELLEEYGFSSPYVVQNR